MASKRSRKSRKTARKTTKRKTARKTTKRKTARKTKKAKKLAKRRKKAVKSSNLKSDTDIGKLTLRPYVNAKRKAKQDEIKEYEKQFFF